MRKVFFIHMLRRNETAFHESPTTIDSLNEKNILVGAVPILEMCFIIAPDQLYSSVEQIKLRWTSKKYFF